MLSPTTVALKMPTKYSRLHNIVNVERLKKYYGDAAFFENRERANRQVLEMFDKDGEQLHLIERLLARRRVFNDNGTPSFRGGQPVYEYQVRWEEYRPEDIGKWHLGWGTRL